MTVRLRAQIIQTAVHLLTIHSVLIVVEFAVIIAVHVQLPAHQDVLNHIVNRVV